MSNNLFSSLSGLKQGLNASWIRDEVILNNIANVNTPNFNRSIVSFEDEYKSAISREQSGFSLRQTRSGHRAISKNPDSVSPRIIEDTVSTMRMDGNNVDMDIETTELAKNTIYYQTLQRQINGEYSQLKMAIREGR